MSTTSKPRLRYWRTSKCTLVTSGQVASSTFNSRASAPLRTWRETPCALKITVADGGTSAQVVHEHRAAFSQALHHHAVMHDFVAHIDRRAVFFQRAFNDFYRAVDAGAKTPRVGEQDLHSRNYTRKGARGRTKLSKMTPPAPMVIAESARLNAGKYQWR